jgi:hypothetical protein
VNEQASLVRTGRGRAWRSLAGEDRDSRIAGANAWTNEGIPWRPKSDNTGAACEAAGVVARELRRK